MNSTKTIQSALISVFHKDGLEPIVKKLNDLGVVLYSTGGTEKFIKDLGIDVIAVETITDYPSILGGRVKTLHPKIFGGILANKLDQSHARQLKKHSILEIQLVVVNLYPFKETIKISNNINKCIEDLRKRLNI